MAKSFLDTLRQMASLAGEMSVMPDADQQFVQQIQQALVQETQKVLQSQDPRQQKMQAAQQTDPGIARAIQAQQQGGVQPGQASPEQSQIPPELMQALMAQQAQQSQSAVGQGVTSGGMMPQNPDEMRRMLATQAGQ